MFGGFLDALDGGFSWAADTAGDVLDFGSDILSDVSDLAEDTGAFLSGLGGIGGGDVIIDATGPISGGGASPGAGAGVVASTPAPPPFSAPPASEITVTGTASSGSIIVLGAIALGAYLLLR